MTSVVIELTTAVNAIVAMLDERRFSTAALFRRLAFPPEPRCLLPLPCMVEILQNLRRTGRSVDKGLINPTLRESAPSTGSPKNNARSRCSLTTAPIQLPILLQPWLRKYSYS